MGSKFSCGPVCGKFKRKKSGNSVPVVDQPVGGDTAACNVCHQLNPVGYDANVFVCSTCRSVNRIHRYGNGERRLSTVEPTPDNEIRLLRHSSTVFAPADTNSTKSYPQPTGSDDNTIPPCAVCLDNPGDMVTLPCCHGGLCEPCALHIASNEAVGGARCPKCRASIDKLVRIAKLGGPITTGVEVPIPASRALRELLCLVQCQRLIDGNVKKMGTLALRHEVRSLHLPEPTTSVTALTKSPQVSSVGQGEGLSPVNPDLCSTLYSEYAVRIDDMLRRFAISVDAMMESKKFIALPREDKLNILSLCAQVLFRWSSIDHVYPYEGVGYTQAALHEIASRKAEKPEMPAIVKNVNVGKVPDRGGSLDCYSKAAFDKSIRQANLELIRKYEKDANYSKGGKGWGQGKGYGKGGKGRDYY
ncbi:hypothetical protein FOL47_008938 [Perkinsus chesapeaki]|uniref:RING-type domain-containing protein n=1 Tax=Perkinsus chesapeaki TaxID=330153 RepID=A0A7J6N1X6_PERCH|nr:hypothetical protein FOL47_008938 [Perkinsus chesapeaki]